MEWWPETGNSHTLTLDKASLHLAALPRLLGHPRGGALSRVASSFRVYLMQRFRPRTGRKNA